MNMPQIGLDHLPRVFQLILGSLTLTILIAPIPSLRLSQTSAPAAVKLDSLPTSLPVMDMHELVERPIFAETRRPLSKKIVVVMSPVVSHVIPVPNTDGMALMGVVHVGARAVALLSTLGHVSPDEVTPGAVIDNWTVEDILADRVLLRSGNARAELVLPRVYARGNQSPTASYPPSGTAPYSMPSFFLRSQ